MRYLVLGAGGGLGQTFLRHLGPKAVGLTRAQCDVTDPNAVREALKGDYAVVINASGYTAVDKAESEPEKAFAVNAKAVETLATECERAGGLLVTYSTDYVFGGDGSAPLTETDPTGPRSVYGKSKLEGEILGLRSGPALVIRTSWLYSETGKSFPRTILTKAIAGEPLKIVDDQRSTPTFAPDLVEATLALIERGRAGLYNYSCSGVTDWNAFATEAIRVYSAQTGRKLQYPAAIKTADLKLAAPRPRYSALNCDKVLREGVKQRSWQEAVGDFVGRLLKSGTL